MGITNFFNLRQDDPAIKKIVPTLITQVSDDWAEFSNERPNPPTANSWRYSRVPSRQDYYMNHLAMSGEIKSKAAVLINGEYFEVEYRHRDKEPQNNRYIIPDGVFWSGYKYTTTIYEDWLSDPKFAHIADQFVVLGVITEGLISEGLESTVGG